MGSKSIGTVISPPRHTTLHFKTSSRPQRLCPRRRPLHRPSSCCPPLLMNTAFAVAPPASSPGTSRPRTGLTPRRVRPSPNAFATPRRTRPCVPLMSTRLPPSDEERAAAAAAQPRNAETSDSYLQCVECSALYVVEPEELEGAPRVVGCSACLHEWYASEADLLWGEDDALGALTEKNSFEAKSRSAKEDTQRAMNAAQGVDLSTKKDNMAKVPTMRDENKRDEQKRKDEVEVRRRKPEPANVGASSKAGPIDEAGEKQGVEKEQEEQSRFNVFVGNLSFRATEEDLYRAFSGYGAVLKCQVPADPSGASRGYGFVEMRSRVSGLKAIESLQGTSIMGRDVSLNEARPRKDNPALRKQQARTGWATRDRPRSRDFASRASGDARGTSGFRKDKKQQKEGAPDRLKYSNNS